MKFLATAVKSEDLVPGDMFSNVGPDYWDLAASGVRGALGERVYLRTLYPIPPSEVGVPIYRITVERDDPNGS